MNTQYLIEVTEYGEIVFCSSYCKGMPEVSLRGGILFKTDTLYTPGDYYFEKGSFYRIGEPPSENHLFNYQTKKWEVNLNRVEQEVLRKRNQLLSESDWTQLPDVPMATQQMWQSYRQALRDITDQENYPLDVVWPTSPKE